MLASLRAAIALAFATPVFMVEMAGGVQDSPRAAGRAQGVGAAGPRAAKGRFPAL